MCADAEEIGFIPADPLEFGEGFSETAVSWEYKRGPVFFLLTRRGDALEIHIRALGRKGKLLTREATRAIIEDIETIYPWCKMLIAPVNVFSVFNMCKKVGFIDCGVGKRGGVNSRIMVINYG